ncbi:MAG: MBL fold metallo-hydrolase [Caldilineales bacterium]|nr:MBL fold metallo-hydrolase [Caldilineales bacterium]
MYKIIDTHFQGQPQIIASYVLQSSDGVALVETGPASALPALRQGLAGLGIEVGEITDIFVTHIHLDHAGAAGWLARESGARVHVHHVGAPHLADPSRLLSSAQRIYGEMMGPLWGETLPVPAAQVHALEDGDVIEAAGFSFHAVDTPGHAYHHMAYLLDGICFTGDVAAARLPGYNHVRLPTPPPEINPPLWRQSLARLRELNPDRLLLTHFGEVDEEPQTHLQAVEGGLDAYLDFVRPRWQAGESAEAMSADFKAWVAAAAAADGCDPQAIARYEMAVPSYMQVGGLLRYLIKNESG